MGETKVLEPDTLFVEGPGSGLPEANGLIVPSTAIGEGIASVATLGPPR